MAAGLIAGAFKGAADAIGSIAEGHIQDERRLSLEQQLSQIEEERQKRIAEHREGIRVKGRQSDTEQDIANMPRVAAAEAAAMKTKGLVKSELEREDVKAKAGDQAYLKGAKAVANAGRADPQYSPSEYAQADALRMKVSDEKRRRELLAERAQWERGGRAGPEERERALARIDRELEQLREVATGQKGKPADETDITRTTEFKYDEAGNVTRKDESTQRRVAPPPSQRDKSAKSREDIDKVHADARRVISQGASKDAVNKRLKDAGYPPI